MTTTSVPTLSPSTDGVLAGIRILLIDDSPDSRLLVDRFLKMEGAYVEATDNARCGIDLALTTDFDIVLMDIQMPEIDGYTATAQLRELGYRQPIVALTAHAMKDEVNRSLNNGFSAHLTKPINRNTLYDHIQRLVGRIQTPTTGPFLN